MINNIDAKIEEYKGACMIIIICNQPHLVIENFSSSNNPSIRGITVYSLLTKILENAALPILPQ